MIFRIIVWIVFLVGGSVLGKYLDVKIFGFACNYLSLKYFVSLLIGIVVGIVMIKISRNTGRTLAKYGREGNLPRMETNVLVKQGIYSYMRHPMHLGLMLFPLSIALIICSPVFIFIISPAIAILMLIMIKFIEEPEAKTKFESEYIEYKKQTPAFCFKISCLKELLKKVEKN